MSELSAGKVSKADLQLMERTSKGTVRDLFWMATGFSPETRWPKPCKEPETLKQCVQACHQQ
eukprot:4189337-Amphidinium_carterae.1